MALELLRLQSRCNKAYVISLEGQKAQALASWPRLQACQNQLIFLDKQAGLQAGLPAKLAKQLKKIHADVVHSHHIGPLLYTGLALSQLQFQQFKATHIHTEHDAWHLQNSKRRLLERACIALFKPRISADSVAVQKALKQYFPNTKSHLILNGVDTDMFKPGCKTSARAQLKLNQANIIIGCAARLEKEKGQDVLIKALAQLPENIHLALAGTGSEHARLLSLVAQLGLEQRVHFLGQLDNMLTFYQSLDVFCLASFHEGMPLAPLEAQACSVPCVLTDVGGSSETLCKKTGLLVEQGKPKALAKALLQRIENRLQNSPRSFVQQNASAKKMLLSYQRLAS